jgi:hypothetical protein
VKCFVPVGTGYPAIKTFEDKINKFLGQTVIQTATEAENTEMKYMARRSQHFDDKRYFRFNVEQSLQYIGLEAYKKRGDIQVATVVPSPWSSISLYSYLGRSIKCLIEDL